MKTTNNKQQTEASVFTELERICRIITDRAVDDKDVAYFRQQIKTALVKVDSLRAAKEEKREKSKQRTALNKRIDELDKEITRVARVSNNSAMIFRLKQEKEKCLEQLSKL